MPVRGCHLAHEPVHLPEGCHSFGPVSTSGWKRPTELLCKRDTARVSLCITKQASTAMVNLIHKVFPTFLVRSSSLVALYIAYASFLKFPQGKRKKKRTWRQGAKFCSSKHTWNAALQCLRKKLSPNKSIGWVLFFLYSSYPSQVGGCHQGWKLLVWKTVKDREVKSLFMFPSCYILLSCFVIYGAVPLMS